jgi:hypothetical protein
MRPLIALILIVYLVGVGVVLSPVVSTAWNNGTASTFANNLAEALPDALAWPVHLARASAGA